MTDAYLYLHTPTPIFRARLNMPSVTYPITELTFDGVTLGAFGDIAADMTLILGSTLGGDDLGRQRVQKPATSTTIPIMRTSEGLEDGEITVVDNAFVEVWDDYRVWSKVPYIDDEGIQYKDTNEPVGTHTSGDEPPVANCGPGFADFIDGDDIITVEFDASNSFAVADGATIVTYAWDVGDGTITVGTSADAQITATFPAGFRWVTLTVTDSNTIPHSAHCPILAVDPADDPLIYDFTAEATITPAGQQFRFAIKQDIPRDDYPDGTLVMFWEGAPASPADRSHIKLIGWEQNNDNDARAVRTGNLRATVVNAVDVAGRLQTLPGFPQSLERHATPDNWDKMVNPTMDKYIHYILLWHSTALGVADYFPSGTGAAYPFVIFASEGESLWEQVNNEAKGLIPGYLFTCNIQGQLAVNVVPLTQNVSARTPTVQATFTEIYTEAIRFAYTRPPRVHWLRGYALLTATSYTDVDGVDTLLTVHSISPGLAPGQGVGEVVQSEGLARSQTDLNAAKGHEYARLNSRYGPIAVTPADDDHYIDVQPANMTWVELTITAETAAQRGLTFTETRCLVKEIRRRWEARRTGALRKSEFTLEVETVGTAAVTVLPEGAPPLPDPPSAPDFGLTPTQELVAGIGEDGFVYRTTDFQTPSGSGGPTWDRVDLSIAGTIYSWVVDPFSPGYLTGAGDISGWIVNDTDIYRVEDLFGAPSVNSVHTFANATDIADGHWRTIQASFGTYFAEGDNPWLLCVSHYGSTAGHEGTWATYSVDGGLTWAAEVLISDPYDLGADDKPIAVFCSPRTPGLGYAMSFYQGGSPSKAGGYKTLDWGATWTLEIEAENPSELRPGFGKVPYGDVYGYLGTPPQVRASVFANDEGNFTLREYISIHPPDGTREIWVEGEYSATYIRTGGFTPGSAGVNLDNGSASMEATGDLPLSSGFADSAPEDGTVGGTYHYTMRRVGSTNWARYREEMEADPDDPSGNQRPNMNASAFSTTPETTGFASISARVVQIEKNDGSFYAPSYNPAIDPGNRLGGSVHLPWENNDDESLMYYGRFLEGSPDTYHLIQSAAGTQTDISPLDGAVSYGPAHGSFGIRAYDGDRNYMALAGIGNDAGVDKVGLWVSSSAGAAWVNVLTPVAATNAQYGLQAAFSGSDPDTLYAWGGYSDGALAAIYFSSDFGVGLDDRTGNLESSFGGVAFVGIAGGIS